MFTNSRRDRTKLLEKRKNKNTWEKTKRDKEEYAWDKKKSHMIFRVILRNWRLTQASSSYYFLSFLFKYFGGVNTRSKLKI